MPSLQLLEGRLNSIAESLKNSQKAYALLGLGSVGLESERMDEYSDLDFFVIVKEGLKQEFIDDLSWLKESGEQGYALRNTVDGYKFLYADGVFCEFAVFELHELVGIPFSEGRVIWAEDGFDCALLKPSTRAGVYERSKDIEWIIGESLTNLYVGLGRFRRGEKLSAFKFVQVFSADRILDLLYIKHEPSAYQVDQYMPDRRVEYRLEMVESLFASFCQGYDKTPESALAQLQWLEENFLINSMIAGEIRELASR